MKVAMKSSTVVGIVGEVEEGNEEKRKEEKRYTPI